MRRYVHQRINTRVFQDAHAVSHNVACVTSHMRSKLESMGVPDIERRVLRLVPTRDGHHVLRTEEGEHWRTYTFIERTVSRVRAESSRDAYEAARAFGHFAALLCDLPPGTLRETIPNFHNTPTRLQRLLRAIEADACGRVDACRDEITMAIDLQGLATALLDLADHEDLTLVPTHNDTKITNVLFDDVTGEAVCIVDLDTVMPGLVLYDVGELVRTACTRAREDEPDPKAVAVDTALLDAVLRGFREGAGSLVSDAEVAAFVLAGRVLAFENGVRFLTDHLEGDTYFRVHRPNHNLDRARAQLTLARKLEKYEGRCPP